MLLILQMRGCKCREVIVEQLVFDTTKEFAYHWCGRFVAPDEKWIHMTRRLTDYEFIAMISGTLYIADKDKEYIVRPGEYLLMEPSELQHGTKSSDCSFYWMHFSYNNAQNNHLLINADEDAATAGMTGQDREQPGEKKSICIHRQGKLSSPERITIMLKELQDSDRRSRDAILNRFLCSAVLAEVALQCKGTGKTGELRKEQTYRDIMDYISWHISENLTVTRVAEYFGYNEKYITTFFKKRAGMSLKQYMVDKRIEKAKALLTETLDNVSQIAYSLGFADAHNFSNAFKKSTGMSPSDYRESYRMHNVFRV